MSMGSLPEERSRLDTDFYQFTMGQYLFRRYLNVRGVDRFTNRTKSAALQHIINEGELNRELTEIQYLSFAKEDLDYLANYRADSGNAIFHEDYLRFLEDLVLPDFKLRFTEGGIDLSFPGPIAETTYWETPALASINELYTSTLMRRYSREEQIQHISQGNLRLIEKIKKLKQHPNVIFSEFGTRRRFSSAHQEMAVSMLKDSLSPAQFIGTSNVLLAKKYGLRPIGTVAHRLFMAMSGIVPQDPASIRGSHHRVLEEWWENYGYDLSIALLDTYGPFGLKDFTLEQAKNWKGIRIDSGNPFTEGEAVIKRYEYYGIDPRTKMLVPSDGLDLETMILLADQFFGRIKISFGWGTNLTNDCGIMPLSLVIKLVEVNGRGTVKLSNNLAKTTGKPDDIERFKWIFGYTSTFNQACRY